MRYCDHSCLTHRWVRHEAVFQIHRADPLAAGFHQVLAAVHQTNTSVSIDHRNITRTKPAVLAPAVAGLRRVVIAAGNPRSPDFKFAHRLSIAWRNSVFVHNARLYEGKRPTLF